MRVVLPFPAILHSDRMEGLGAAFSEMYLDEDIDVARFYIRNNHPTLQGQHPDTAR